MEERAGDSSCIRHRKKQCKTTDIQKDAEFTKPNNRKRGDCLQHKVKLENIKISNIKNIKYLNTPILGVTANKKQREWSLIKHLTESIIINSIHPNSRRVHSPDRGVQDLLASVHGLRLTEYIQHISVAVECKRNPISRNRHKQNSL